MLLEKFFIWFVPLAVTIQFFACAQKSDQQCVDFPQSTIDSLENLYASSDIQRDTSLHRYLSTFGLVPLSDVDSTIVQDVKYATSDNFMGEILYHHITEIYLQADVAERLRKAHLWLKERHPEYRFLVYDGVRPLSVQKYMWKALDSIPPHVRGKYVSNPAHGSVHNYGAAVDITIIDSEGNPLDMGAGYDDFREIAYPSKEEYYLKTGELSNIQVKNRKLLRAALESEGFRNIPSEWWHFNAFSREATKMKYKKLNEEFLE